MSYRGRREGPEVWDGVSPKNDITFSVNHSGKKCLALGSSPSGIPRVTLRLERKDECSSLGSIYLGTGTFFVVVLGFPDLVLFSFVL